MSLVEVFSNKKSIHFKKVNHIIVLFLISVFSINSFAQVISQFNWDSGDIRVANIGPNFINGQGTTSAVSSSNGVDGTNGLNAGLPKEDLNLVLTDSPIFDVNGIDISFDYQRDESQGTFFSRGSSLVIQGCNQLAVSYRVEDGAGSYTIVNSGNVYSIPNDDIFRTYRFYYLPSTGVGTLLVDNSVVWTNDGPDEVNMYWSGAGDIMIGYQMDGSGANKTFLDNLTISEVYDSPLPVEFMSFDVYENDLNEVDVIWETASEINNNYFTIESSKDAKEWEELSIVEGAGNSTNTIRYNYVDNSSKSGIVYYRIKQTDFDGKTSYSSIKYIEFDDEVSTISVYPNPTKDILNVTCNDINSISVYNTFGEDVTHLLTIVSESDDKVSFSTSKLTIGTYIIKSNETYTRFLKVN